ncbi:metalloregulator ArsR/SmtB family transcription factor [Sphingomonas sp.]|uniref:ArsR/SmtB family transcription factor n=1 Tax=Sphingomonas sp. TaxID=28214 RepID=UPI00286E184F|nr:metalloregulator ArsR/SmtB family transcription factor [Sphingomonas sp.]
MAREDAVFKAIADERRRAILAALAERPMAVHEVTALFAISRPAVSKHLRVLSEAGLVHAARSGQENLYRADVDALAAVSDWLGRMWAGRLRTLKDLAERKH